MQYAVSQRCSVKNVLKPFAEFTGKHLCRSLFFNKFVGLSPTTLLKKGLQHRRFPANFAKFYEHLFYRTAPVAASENSVITIWLTTLTTVVKFP